MTEEYWFQKAGICRNPNCNYQLKNYHGGECPMCGTWQNEAEDPGITWETNVEFTGKTVKEVFEKKGGKRHG